MKYRLQVLALSVFFLSSLASITLCQNPPENAPSSAGDYYSNEAPFKGTVHSPFMRGSLWQVVANKLNCRSGPGINHSIVRELTAGAVIQAEVGRGGADEVLLNSRDSYGRPWMPVRGGKNPTSPETKCYVRANRHYIQPYSPDR